MPNRLEQLRESLLQISDHDFPKVLLAGPERRPHGDGVASAARRRSPKGGVSLDGDIGGSDHHEGITKSAFVTKNFSMSPGMFNCLTRPSMSPIGFFPPS